MISIATIPYLGCYFKGCICVIHYKGYEYRLATYLGVQILSWNENEICLKQGIYFLKIQIYRNVKTKEDEKGTKSKFAHKLYAPTLEGMSKQISEEIFCSVRTRLYEGFRLLFDLSSDKANFEMVKK
jgi:tocopherol cyclase